ncbi:MAG: hypothetical protein KGL39_46265, partial [Patescibacteria group bacterium]|nr:hypothetical protein [Patescibacteria group bacterium]
DVIININVPLVSQGRQVYQTITMTDFFVPSPRRASDFRSVDIIAICGLSRETRVMIRVLSGRFAAMAISLPMNRRSNFTYVVSCRSKDS